VTATPGSCESLRSRSPLARGRGRVCNPILLAESPAPPGRSARLDPVEGFWAVKSYRLELSQGAAKFAVSCSRGASVRAHDGDVRQPGESPRSARPRWRVLRAEHLRLWRRRAARGGGRHRRQGRRATTQLHVHAEQGDRDVAVTIIPQPAPATDRRARARCPGRRALTAHAGGGGPGAARSRRAPTTTVMLSSPPRWFARSNQRLGQAAGTNVIATMRSSSPCST